MNGLHAAKVVLGTVRHTVLVHLEETWLALCKPQSASTNQPLSQCQSSLTVNTVRVHVNHTNVLNHTVCG